MTLAAVRSTPAPAGGGKRGGAMKRHAAPKTAVIAMDQVPPSPERMNVTAALYAQICELRPGAAMKAEFDSEGHADYVRSKLRSLAKKDKRFLSSSRSADGRTRYFWLEKL